MPPEAGIKLRAEDADDLSVLSACLQDALVAVRDLAYDPDARSFYFVANRFRWEGCDPSAGDAAIFERSHCGVSFAAVDGVAYRGFRRSEEDRILALLAIRPALAAEGGTIDLDFAEGATIRLSAERIRCVARDFGEPWPTAWRPGHLLDDGS